MTLRDDHVRIALGRETMVLPRASYELLLAELRHSDSMRDIRKAFETTQPPQLVHLTRFQKLALTDLIEQLANDVDVGPTGELPAGIVGLQRALRDDLHNGRSD